MDVTKTLWFRAIRFRFLTHKLWTATECLITSLHYKINTTNSSLYECQPQHRQEALRECRFPLCLIWRIWNNVLLKVPECPLFHAGLVMNMSWKSVHAFPVMLLTGIQTNLLARIKTYPSLMAWVITWSKPYSTGPVYVHKNHVICNCAWRTPNLGQYRFF